MTINIFRALKKNRILKAGSLSLMATVITRAVNLISVPIFSRLLSTAEYGRVDVFMTFVFVFVIITGLDFQAAVGKGRLDFKKDADEFTASSMLFSTAVVIILVVIINAIYGFLAGFWGMDRYLVNLMLIYSYSLFVISYRSAEYNFYFEYKKNMLMSASVALGNLILSIIFIETLFSEDHVLGRVLGATIPTLICAIMVWVFYGNRGRWRMKWNYIKYSLLFGVPLIPHNLSHLVLGGSDKVMIQNMIGASESGIYSLSYTLGMMIQVLTEAMNQVFGPWLFRKLEAKEHKTVSIAQKGYLLLYSFITVPVLALSPEIVKIIGAKEYWDGTSVIMWIVYATFLMFTYTIYVNLEFYEKKTAMISAGTIGAALINILLNYVFLTKIGYQFGAYSTVISYACLLIFHCVIVNFVLKIRIVDNAFVFFIVSFVFAVTISIYYLKEMILARCFVFLVSDAVLGWCIVSWYRRNRAVMTDIGKF